MSGTQKLGLKSWDELVALAKKLQQSGKIIVTTNGCFDLLHRGHVEYLEQARKLGDCLFVGINSDDSVKKLKGPGRPLNEASSRGTVLSALRCVDGVTVFDQDTPVEWLKSLKPQIHAKGGDYKEPHRLPEFAALKTWGGKLEIIPFVEGFSTTSIVSKMKSR